MTPEIPMGTVSAFVMLVGATSTVIFLPLFKRSFPISLLSLCTFAQSNQPIKLDLDLTDAPRKILHGHLVIPVEPGPLTLVYPEWIPGEHAPSGPIDNFAGLVLTANGQSIPWQRDDVNMFAFHLTVPPGVTSLEARVDFLATAAPSGLSAGASTSPNLAVVSWNEVALYPAGTPAAEVKFTPSVKVPEGWKLGTALTTSGVEGATSQFETVSLETLVDSPVLAGRFFKEIPLAPEISPKHFLDMAGDGPEDLNLSADEIAAYSNLVKETGALYKSRHYNHYNFLFTLSDSVAHFGLEHHQSSDDRVDARNFLDDDLKLINGSLLPHEFTHSWNGKYRRPVGLATANFQQPMKGNLLWVYEGLTEYFGDVLSARSGLWTTDQYREALALSAAEMDHRPGRTWRDLQDTATAAQTLYSTVDEWDNWRRSVDFYSEGELIWLDVDTTLRKLSGGRRSLNDFAARFLGAGGNTPPEVVPYNFADIVGNLVALEPYDWQGFLEKRLTTKSPHAPLDGIVNGGYKLEYDDKANEFARAMETRDRGVNAWYSLGFVMADETIRDVLVNSPAFQAGLGPGMKLIAINGRKATDELLHNAIRDAKTSAERIELIVENAGYVKVVKIDYHEGEKYPHLVRQPNTPALLDEILKPLTAHSRSS
jgi:predicted metalloprotease with PDZ domain